jgi:hypothetical protein
MSFHLVKKSDLQSEPPNIGGRILQVDDLKFGDFCLIEYDVRELDKYGRHLTQVDPDSGEYEEAKRHFEVERSVFESVVRPDWFRRHNWSRYPIKSFVLGVDKFDVCAKGNIPVGSFSDLSKGCGYRIVCQNSAPVLSAIEQWSIRFPRKVRFLDDSGAIFVEFDADLTSTELCSLLFCECKGKAWNGISAIMDL